MNTPCKAVNVSRSLLQSLLSTVSTSLHSTRSVAWCGFPGFINEARLDSNHGSLWEPRVGWHGCDAIWKGVVGGWRGQTDPSRLTTDARRINYLLSDWRSFWDVVSFESSPVECVCRVCVCVCLGWSVCMHVCQGPPCIGPPCSVVCRVHGVMLVIDVDASVSSASQSRQHHLIDADSVSCFFI